MIRLMIDSASDISKAEAEAMGITMIPMIITFGMEDYYDGVNLTPNKFFEKLIESSDLPKTSLITAFRFEEEFEKYVSLGDEIIMITISSKLSGTYKNAVDAAKKFNGKVRVIDSLNACIGERLLCQYTLELIKQGLSLDEIIQNVEHKKSKIKVMALLNTLEYLKRGGRISSAVAFAGEVIALKPVVGIVNGEVKLIGKALGSRRGNNQLNKLIKECKGIDFSMPYGVIWSGFDVTALDKYVNDSFELWGNETNSLPRYPLGATIGTHVGPGAVGVAFFEKE